MYKSPLSLCLFSDINECTKETHNCSSDAVCYNTEGSYNCACKPGYHGDGVNCSIGEWSVHVTGKYQLNEEYWFKSTLLNEFEYEE